MKKTLLVMSCLAGMFAQSAWSQITLTASPTSQTVNQGGTFNVQISLNVTGTTPANADGFNLWLETAAANSGLFAVTADTSNVSGWTTPAGAQPFPESITTTGSTHAGFAQNAQSLGWVDTSGGSNAHATPLSGLNLETLTLSVAANTAPGTYTFATTSATSDPRTSSINDNQGNSFNVNTPATFSITVVPEPATWSLLSVGALAMVGLNMRRARRRI